MNAIEAVKNNDLESIKLLIGNGENFDSLSWTDWQSLTKEVYDLFKEQNVEIGFNNIMATQDKRIHKELLDEDKNLFYKESVWRPIVHFEWVDLFDWDWDFEQMKGSMHLVESVLVTNNIKMAEVLFGKTDEVFVSDLIKAKSFLTQNNETFDSKILELFIEKKLGSLEQVSSIDQNGLSLLYKEGYFDVIEKSGFFQNHQINGLIELAKHLIKDKLQIHSLSKPPYKLSEEDSNLFIDLVKDEQYDMNEQCMDFVLKFENSYNKQCFSFTPLSFLKHFVTSKEKTKLITKVLKQSDNLFENQVFKIVETRGGGAKTVYIAEYYFDTFNSKTNQKTFVAKMTPEKYKTLSKRNKELFDKFK